VRHCIRPLEELDGCRSTVNMLTLGEVAGWLRAGGLESRCVYETHGGTRGVMPKVPE
jgi:hypothetical protein